MLIFTSANVQADSAEKFIGTFPNSGAKCYLLVETVNHIPDESEIGMQASFRIVEEDDSSRIVDYAFGFEEDSAGKLITFYETSEGERGFIDSADEDSIEYKMFRAVANAYSE